MSTPTHRPAMVPINALYRDQVTHEDYWTTVYGQLTDNKHLAIIPGFDEHGGLTEHFRLVHLPTGRVVYFANPRLLREMASQLAHLDWEHATLEDFPGSPMAKEASEIIKKLRYTQPDAVELPAHDGWGPDGAGKGLKRAAMPRVTDILADFQHAWKKVHGDDPIPLDVPDPANPDKTKPNPEWTFWVFRQVYDFAVAYLLLVLHQLDARTADSAAAFLADQMESGESVGEWMWQWHQALVKGERVKVPGTVQLGELFTPRGGS